MAGAGARPAAGAVVLCRLLIEGDPQSDDFLAVSADRMLARLARRQADLPVSGIGVPFGPLLHETHLDGRSERPSRVAEPAESSGTRTGCSSDSLSAGSNAAAIAAARCAVAPETLAGSLPGEARLVLPVGPAFRLPRPPRDAPQAQEE